VLKLINVVLDPHEVETLNKYGEEEDKKAKMTVWNYFDVFNKVNEKALKVMKGSNIR
jgi:hypothetical protein